MEPVSLPVEFIRMAHRFRRIHMIDLFGEVSRGEFFVLDNLYKHEAQHPDAQGMYASDLAMAMRISPPGLSRLLKQLEAKGYIERVIDQDRRRNIYIRLTGPGRKTRHQIKGQMIAFSNRVVDGMGEDNLREMMRLCEQMMDIIEAEAKRMEGEQPDAQDHKIPEGS